jgi:hypothetical protein
MAKEYTNLFHSKALQIGIFGLKIYHLATLAAVMGEIIFLARNNLDGGEFICWINITCALN